MRSQDFERLYEQHARSLLAFLVYRTGDRTLAEDLLADTFERVLRTPRGFDRRRGSEKTWLYAIALNLLRDHQRRAVTGARVLEAVAAVPHQGLDQLEVAHTRDEVHRALSALSPEERETVALRYGADMTVVEIARLTREKPSTIHGRVYRSCGS